MAYPFFPTPNFQNSTVFKIKGGLHIHIPDVVRRALEEGADLAISCSGGKDSDAQLRILAQMHRELGYSGRIFAVFADLGRIEWIGVVEHIQRLCNQLGVELITVKRPQGGLIDRWDQRMASIAVDTVLKIFQLESSQIAQLKKAILPQLPSVLFPDDAYQIIFQLAVKEKNLQLNSTGDWIDNVDVDRIIVPQASVEELLQHETIGDRPHFSSSANRYCTADSKRLQIDGKLRKSRLVVCAVGIRAEESPNRAKEPRYCVRNQISSKHLKMPAPEKGLDKVFVSAMEEDWADQVLDRWLDSGEEGRLALTWHPIHSFTLEQVWQANGTSVEDLQHRRSLWQRGHYRDAIAGFPGHWAYVSNNSRLSCTQCVLASNSDITNGAMFHPLEWLEIAMSESLSGWSFKQKYWLMDLSDQISQLDLKKRRVILRILTELGLIRQWPYRYTLDILTVVPLECLKFWTVAFLEGLLNELKTTEEEPSSLHLLRQ